MRLLQLSIKLSWNKLFCDTVYKGMRLSRLFSLNDIDTIFLLIYLLEHENESDGKRRIMTLKIPA